MDVVRPELKQNKRRRRWKIGAGMVVMAVAAAAGLSYIGQAVPSVTGNSIIVDTVRKGEFVRSVRGPGILAPKQIRWVVAETDARIERVSVKPGAAVTADTVILELSNSDMMARLDTANAEMIATRSDIDATRAELDSRLLDLESSLTAVVSGYEVAKIQKEADQIGSEKGVVSAVQFKKSAVIFLTMSDRLALERRRVTAFRSSMQAELNAANLRLAQLADKRDELQRQVDALRVRAGIDGVLQHIEVEEGERVTGGARLARVARPGDLIAELKIAETQARDIAIGQQAKVDTRNGVVDGRVLRIDPAVRDGAVRVDIEFPDALPAGARPDLSVDGTIEIERLRDTLYVGRPAGGQSNMVVTLFRVDADGDDALRVSVRLGKLSATEVQIVDGLRAGDRVGLSDTSSYNEYPRITIK